MGREPIACGALNTGGNLGGVINIPIIAWLSGHGRWYGAFATGTAFAVVAAALWLLIDADRQLPMAYASDKSNGSLRRRLPVNAATALAIAGAMGGTPGSPRPVGGSSLGTKYTATDGASVIRGGG